MKHLTDVLQINSNKHVCVLSCFSRVRLFATTWTVAHQIPLSMGFSRQEHWSGLPCPPPGDLPNSGLESRSPALQVDSLPSKPLCVLSHFSCVWFFATLWAVALQASLSMGFSRQEDWNGCHDLPDPGREPESLTAPALPGRFFNISATWETQIQIQSLSTTKRLPS